MLLFEGGYVLFVQWSGESPGLVWAFHSAKLMIPDNEQNRPKKMTKKPSTPHSPHPPADQHGVRRARRRRQHRQQAAVDVRAPLEVPRPAAAADGGKVAGSQQRVDDVRGGAEGAVQPGAKGGPH